MLDLAVVGAGVMGTNHARIARTIKEVRLKAVVDPQITRARVLAAAHGAEAYARLEDVVAHVDAVVISAPTPLHLPLASLAIEAGRPLLVEKPLAPTRQEGIAIVQAARAAGVRLAVGHVERFNPAVLELDNILEKVVHIEAARVSPFSTRVTGDVVIDLMIHDVDLALAVAQSEASEIQALGQRVRSDETDDLVTALVQFENGITASLTANRVGQHKIRRLEITQESNFIYLDLVRSSVEISRVDYSEFLSTDGTRYRQSGVVEIPFLEHRGEPLFLELSDFVAAVLENREPRVSGDAGLRALETALSIRDAIRPGSSIYAAQ